MGIIMQGGLHHHSTCQGVIMGWFNGGPVTFLFAKLKENISRTKFLSNSDVKTAAENRLNGRRRDFCQAGLNKLVLRSDKCLNRFGDYVEE
ncbi:hypothetical protein AVEN_227431-1 [Araneus ventricosus]|uniref:Uncharacterized protein n=1 Tax=Araneus ventricosus TaxID=182803 RepID=A0A4Y2D8H3_ARAVE|nr:hypothetical protein AVEN_227431-1 [Araneus ventricosus]